jgi:hypothetical protein
MATTKVVAKKKPAKSGSKRQRADRMPFARRVKESRVAAGWSRKKLAELASSVGIIKITGQNIVDLETRGVGNDEMANIVAYTLDIQPPDNLGSVDTQVDMQVPLSQRSDPYYPDHPPLKVERLRHPGEAIDTIIAAFTDLPSDEVQPVLNYVTNFIERKLLTTDQAVVVTTDQAVTPQ